MQKLFLESLSQKGEYTYSKSVEMWDFMILLKCLTSSKDIPVPRLFSEKKNIQLALWGLYLNIATYRVLKIWTKNSNWGGRGSLCTYKSLIPPAYSMYIHYWYRLMSPSSVVSPVPLITNQPIKGTVARDFWPPIFSTNRPHIVPKFTP
jgi:hypothetical protein